MLEDVHAFEVHPHRMRGIRQPSRGERVRGQQITEFIGDHGSAGRQYRQEHRTCRQRGQPRTRNGQAAPACKVVEGQLCGTEPSLTGTRSGECDLCRDQQSQQFDEIYRVSDCRGEQPG